MDKKALTHYDATKVVRVSQELYQISSCRWRMSTPGYRLLFALAQSVGGLDKNMKFPELWFDKETLFKYLGLTTTERKYELLSKTLAEITAVGLHLSGRKKNGSLVWEGFTWVTSYRVAEDEKMVMIQLNEKVKPFLIGLKQYASIQPKYYLKLSTEYQNWFYPYFKNVVKLGRWEVSIDELKQALFLEKRPSYNSKQTKNATEKFLRRVIGIEISEAAKVENQAAKAKKREPAPIAWNYTKDSKGEYTGTLAGITTHSDINVYASVRKTGRSYTHIVFFLSEKASERTAYRLEQIGKEIPLAEQDLGKRQNKRERSGGKSMNDLFEGMFTGELVKNPAYEKEIPTPRIQCYTRQQIEELATESGITFEKALSLLKVEKNEKGEFSKKY